MSLEAVRAERHPPDPPPSQVSKKDPSRNIFWNFPLQGGPKRKSRNFLEKKSGFQNPRKSRKETQKISGFSFVWGGGGLEGENPEHVSGRWGGCEGNGRDGRERENGLNVAGLGLSSKEKTQEKQKIHNLGGAKLFTFLPHTSLNVTFCFDLRTRNCLLKWPKIITKIDLIICSWGAGTKNYDFPQENAKKGIPKFLFVALLAYLGLSVCQPKLSLQLLHLSINVTQKLPVLV